MQRTRATLGILSTVGFLFGCDVPQNELTRIEENGLEICEGRLITTPAVVETITTQIEVSPAIYNDAGQITTDAVYETKTQQNITTDRVETRFEAVCPSVMTPEFIATLQRALAARQIYAGPINGRTTQATKAAFQTYQSQSGLNSPILSVKTARQLGLITIDLPKN